MSEANASTDSEIRLRRIYSWASRNTSESRQTSDFKYVWPSSVTKLLEVLELSEGSLIALAGLSGVGKSSAQVQLARALSQKFPSKKFVQLKWPGYLEQNSSRILELLKIQGLSPGNEDVIPLLSERLSRRRDQAALRRRLADIFGGELVGSSESDIACFLEKISKDKDMLLLAERILGPSELKIFHFYLVVSLLSSCHTILIDLRDYGLKDSRTMNTDLWEVQRLWQLIIEHLNNTGAKTSPPNLVFVLQKELIASKDDQQSVSYFLRKTARQFEILPFSKQELIRAYTEEFESLDPFEEGALNLLAIYSRGIFRRFLRYIQLCLDYQLEAFRNLEDKSPKITVEVVDKIVTVDEIASDMRIELHRLFTHGQYEGIAIHAMKLVSSIPATLTELSEVMANHANISDLSRIITKLEEYGYVKRTQTNRGKVISANW